jgi:hypothetical protein
LSETVPEQLLPQSKLTQEDERQMTDLGINTHSL